jgi:dTDP-L-rhamnose 4-epimerase
VDSLIEAGHSVRVFDNLETQVHGHIREQQKWPDYASPGAEYILGDVRDLDGLGKAIDDTDIIYHFAAVTGVGQSAYQIAKYTEVNIQGTANLLDNLLRRNHHVEKIILASSRAIYGEGLYYCDHCGPVTPDVRNPEALEQKKWEVTCPHCSRPIRPVQTPETKRPDPGSIYGITKLSQEQLCLSFSHAYQIPSIVLRFFNVYGPRQSPTNPYTGIITTFLQRLQNGEAPEVYEDGLMTRDFVFVSDVVTMCHSALELDQSIALNVGTGQFITILEIADLICQRFDLDVKPQITGIARLGDIRHCSADMTRASKAMRCQPSVSLQEGLSKVLDGYVDKQVIDQSSIAKNELRRAGLLK